MAGRYPTRNRRSRTSRDSPRNRFTGSRSSNPGRRPRIPTIYVYIYTHIYVYMYTRTHSTFRARKIPSLENFSSALDHSRFPRVERITTSEFRSIFIFSRNRSVSPTYVAAGSSARVASKRTFSSPLFLSLAGLACNLRVLTYLLTHSLLATWLDRGRVCVCT